LVTCIWAAYFAAFGFPCDFTWVVIDSGVEFFFLIDIILNFFTKYKSKKEREVKDLKKIAKRYLKGMFIFDVIATFPFRWVFFQEETLEDQEKSQLLFLLKLLRLPKMKILLDS
jgi:hypothetical protein